MSNNFAAAEEELEDRSRLGVQGTGSGQGEVAVVVASPKIRELHAQPAPRAATTGEGEGEEHTENRGMPMVAAEEAEEEATQRVKDQPRLEVARIMTVFVEVEVEDMVDWHKI